MLIVIKEHNVLKKNIGKRSGGAKDAILESSTFLYCCN